MVGVLRGGKEVLRRSQQHWDCVFTHPAPPPPRLQLKKSQPDLKLGEVGKATGEAWKALSDKVGGWVGGWGLRWGWVGVCLRRRRAGRACAQCRTPNLAEPPHSCLFWLRVAGEGALQQEVRCCQGAPWALYVRAQWPLVYDLPAASLAAPFRPPPARTALLSSPASPPLQAKYEKEVAAYKK